MDLDSRIRLGILGLPLAGVFSMVSALIPGAWVDPATDPLGFAQASTGVGLSNMIGIVGAVSLMIGVQSLFWALIKTRNNSLALTGWLSTLVGMLLFLSFSGIFAFAAPVIGAHYLSGETSAVRIISESTSTSNLSAFLFGGTGVFLLFVGGLAIAGAVWKSGMSPKWIGIIYAVGSMLVIDPLYIYQPTIAIIGGVLLLTSGTWMAKTIGKF